MSDVVQCLMSVLNSAGIPAYGIYMPDSVVALMPTRAVSIIPTGGEAAPWHYEVDNEIVEVRCYGQDSVEALEVYRDVVDTLRRTFMVTIGNTTLLAATKLSGPIFGVEPETEWEFVSATFRAQVRLDEP